MGVKDLLPIFVHSKPSPIRIVWISAAVYASMCLVMEGVAFLSESGGVGARHRFRLDKLVSVFCNCMCSVSLLYGTIKLMRAV